MTGIVQRDIEQWVQAEPATVQERRFDRLYLLRPWLLLVTAFFWVAIFLGSHGHRGAWAGMSIRDRPDERRRRLGPACG